MFFMTNKVILITGGGRGIGRAIGERFAKEGVRIVLVDLDEKNLSAAASSITSLGAKVLTIAANVAISEDVSRVVKETVTAFGAIDVLVNNAGIVRDATLLKMTEEAWDAVIDVNLKGVFLCGQAVAKVMAEKKSGRIINISSLARRGLFGQSNYSASKAGVVGLTKTWALELSKYGILVNAIAPGLISTDMTASIPPEVRANMLGKIPLGREGNPSDIAELAYFLASEGSSYIQGEVIPINGGLEI